jgi:hypothetical protein
MDKKIINLNMLIDARNIDSDDWEDLCNDVAVIELPDGSQWRRPKLGNTKDHYDAIEEIFKRKNRGLSSVEAMTAQSEAIEKGLPVPYFDWSMDAEWHDVFETIDGKRSYCLLCESYYPNVMNMAAKFTMH